MLSDLRGAVEARQAVERRRVLPTAFSPALSGAREVVSLVRRLADAQGRDDLVVELDAVTDELAVEAVPVLVVGGAGQGKTSVVNALVGAPVSQTGPRSSTAVPVELTHGTAYTAEVTSEPLPGRAGDVSTRPVPYGDASSLASREFNPDNQRRLRAITLTAPSSTLARGLVLIDTPPITDALSAPSPRLLRSAAGAAALVLVSSAASPLAPGELDFLRVASSLCPRVIVVVNGTNRFDDWRAVVDRNELLLEQRGLSAPVFAVDPTPYWSDVGGVPPGPDPGMVALASHLENDVVLDTEQQRISRALTDTFWAADRLKMRLAAERSLIDNAARLDDARQRLRTAAQASHDLCSPGAGWNQLLAGRLDHLRADLNTDLELDLLRVRERAAELAAAAGQDGGWERAYADLHRELADVIAYRQRVLRLSIRACSREVAEQFQAEWSEVVAGTDISPETHALVSPRLDRSALSGPRPLADIELHTSSTAGVAALPGNDPTELPPVFEAWLTETEELLRFEMRSSLVRAGRDIASRCGVRSLELHRSLVEVLTSLSVLGQLDSDAVSRRRSSLAVDLEQLHTVDWSFSR